MAEDTGQNDKQQDVGGKTAGNQEPSCVRRSWSLHPNNTDQPSLKLILNASTSSLHSQLPSYEDAIKSCADGEASEGRIISTCLNTGKMNTWF